MRTNVLCKVCREEAKTKRKYELMFFSHRTVLQFSFLSARDARYGLETAETRNSQKV